VNDLGVSVVITCHEPGCTLLEAIDSVLGQTEPASEVVVVDAGSRDALTLELLPQLEREVPRVRLISSGHHGPGRARNVGIAETTTPVVALLDSRGVFDPTYLQKAGEVLREDQYLSFVCCAVQAFGDTSFRWTPPLYAVADVIARGGCGDISPVFRRELWERIGGFDEALKGYEDVDFWLRALELGFCGTILDEALVCYRLGSYSRNRRLLMRSEHAETRGAFLDQHLQFATSQGDDVLVAALEFERELVVAAHAVEEDRRELCEQVAQTEEEGRRAHRALRERGIAAFRAGALSDRRTIASKARVNGASSAVEQHLLRRALDELEPEVRPPSELTIRPGDAWPGGTAPEYDLVVILAALEQQLDPATALARCRAALRPEGELIVLATTMALGADRSRGFTEASLRSLLRDLFPGGDVHVVSYGNLLTCLGSALNAPLSAFTSSELEAADPEHPTVVAASARLPRAQRRLGPPDLGGVRPRAGLPSRHIGRSVILAYHRVAALRPDTWGLCTPPDRFRAQMELLAARYRPMPLDELAASAGAGDMLGAVAVTLDDGYLDNFEVASPILRELQIPVTFFINRACVDAREGWWDSIERMLLGDRPVPSRLRLRLGDAMLDLATGTLRERRSALLTLHGRLLEADPEEVHGTVAQMQSWTGSELPVRDSHRLMTAREVLTLSRRPRHQIGAHGLNHRMLPGHSADVQMYELSACKAELEHLLGAAVDTFAYPYGACDFESARIAEECGFTLACVGSVEPDPVTCDSDPLRLPRIGIGGEDLQGFRAKLEQTLAARG
jgi:peptidoglycan/xylan/chitin deacetylase (PgdA/CDA1 family)/GT2 family glycosyltransferase